MNMYQYKFNELEHSEICDYCHEYDSYKLPIDLQPSTLYSVQVLTNEGISDKRYVQVLSTDEASNSYAFTLGDKVVGYLNVSRKTFEQNQMITLALKEIVITPVETPVIK